MQLKIKNCNITFENGEFDITEGRLNNKICD